MKLESVDNLLRLADEYKVLQSSFLNNNSEAREAIEAIVVAANEAYERDAERASEVKSMLDDEEGSDSAKRMYSRELQSLRSKKYGATKGDEEDFAALMEELREQNVTLKRLRNKIKDAVRAVNADIADIQSATCYDKSAIAHDNWIEHLEKDFRVKCLGYKAPGEF